MTTKNKEFGWVPLIGEFTIDGANIVFQGKGIRSSLVPEQSNGEHNQQAANGILLSSASISDGDLCAEIEFEKVTPETMAALMVSYSPMPLHFVAAGLGLDYKTMYAVTEMRTATATTEPYLSYPAVGGDRSGLKAKRKYNLNVQFRGNYVVLRIDDVEVVRCFVTPSWQRMRQVGILCRADHRITIRSFRPDSLKPKVFVIMEFGTDFDDVYNDVIKGVRDEYDLLRADDIHKPGLIIADIEQSIHESQLIVADITAPNLNVFFEVGYAMALNKPIIFLARKGTSLPFDVAGRRVLFYENTIGGKARLEEGLKRHLESYMGSGG